VGHGKEADRDEDDAERCGETAGGSYVEKSTVVSHVSIRGIMAQEVPRIMAEKSTVKYTTN
jgi:hypothetical protein